MIETALAVPITGNFETLGSKFSNETRLARLLASLLQFGNSISNSNTYTSYDDKQKRNFPVAAVIETALAVPITGNFETLGSKFSHETAGLLASFATFRKFHLKNYLFYKRLFNSSASSSNPGLPNKANIFFLYASTPG